MPHWSCIHGVDTISVGVWDFRSQYSFPVASTTSKIEVILILSSVPIRLGRSVFSFLKNGLHRFVSCLRKMQANEEKCKFLTLSVVQPLE